MLATDKTQFRAQASQWHLPNLKNFIPCSACLCVDFSLGFYGRKVSTNLLILIFYAKGFM